MRGRSASTSQKANGACSSQAEALIRSGVQYGAWEPNEFALTADSSRSLTFIAAPIRLDCYAHASPTPESTPVWLTWSKWWQWDANATRSGKLCVRLALVQAS